jgi:hypothetical protein
MTASDITSLDAATTRMFQVLRSRRGASEKV